MWEWTERQDHHYEASLFIKDVLNDKRRHDADPEACRLNGQISEGLPELRVELKAAINFPRRGEHLWPEADFPRPNDERN